MLRNGLDEVRAFITDLRPPVVDVGLAAAIADRARQLEERHGIASRSNVDGIDERLSQRPAHRSFASSRRHCRTFASTRRPAASPSASRETPS